RCQGGICRSDTRVLIERAHGRVSSYVTSDIGAIESVRWHASHFSWKIGAMSFVNVGFAGTSAFAKAGEARLIATPRAATPRALHVVLISKLLWFPPPWKPLPIDTHALKRADKLTKTLTFVNITV